MSRARRVVAFLSFGLLLAYLAVILAFAAFQRSLLYFPSPRSADEEGRIARALGYESLPARGDAHAAFLVPTEGEADATLVVAHGNGGDALSIERFVELARGQALRFDVISVEYPGYGARRGHPTERGNVDAVLDAIDVATRRGPPVVLLGESLGSAVVSLAAAERRDEVAAVILTTPLPRMALVAAHHYPFVPTFLLADRYEADAAIARYGGPVAFIVAADDEVIPAHLGLAMHSGYPGSKTLVVAPAATHNTVDYSPDRPEMRRVFQFVEAAVRRVLQTRNP